MPLPLAVPIAMAAIGLGGKIFGGRKSGQAMGEAEGIVDKQVSDLTTWYDTEKNRDFLQSNLGSAAMNKVLQDIEERNQQIESTAAVTGASDAAKIAQKAKSQERFGDVVKDLASYGTARKDRIEGRYRSGIGQLMGQKVNLATGRAQSAANLGGAGGDLISAAGSLFGSTKFGGGGTSLMSDVGYDPNLTGRAATAASTMSDILG